MTEISHMQRSASLHMRETLRPVPLPRSKTPIEPVSKEPGWSQRCQDQQKVTQGAKMFEEEKDEEKDPCTALLPSQSLPQPPCPHSSASALRLPPTPLPRPPRSGQIPLCMEILPKETRPPELSNLEQSTSLHAVKPKPPTSHHQTVHRSKSDSEPVFQKLASFFLSRDQQKANRGAKKPLDNCNQNRRPVRPPPPNIGKSRGGYKSLLPIQMSTGGHLNSSDTQDGDGESSLKMLEGDGEKEPCTPLLPSQRLPQPPSPCSSASALPLRRPPPPPLPPIICVSEQGQIPLYLEIMQEETRPTEKPLDNCNQNQSSLRPPTPNFSKSRGGHKPLLQIQMSTVGPLNSSDTQDGDGLKMFEKDDDEEKEPCTPILPSQSLPQPPSPRSSASALPLRRPPPPPLPPIICVSEQGQIPLYLEIIPEETRPTEAIRSKVVHDFFTKRPVPPVPQSQSEPLYEELGSCVKNEDSEERKLEDIEVLMAWWRTVEEWDNMPLDYELKEEEEMRLFTHTAYRIKMGLRLFICLLSKNSESLQNHIIELKATADNFDNARKKAKIAAIAGGTTGAVGGVASLVAIGIVLSPVTLGASLVVSAVGVAVVGGLAGASVAISNKVNHKRVEKIVLHYWNEVSDIKRCLHFVCMGMGWLGQQDTSRLRVTDKETVAVARLVEFASGISSSIQTTCQFLEMLQKFSLDMDVFFHSGVSQKVKKGTETKFANKIRSLAQLLQDGLNSLKNLRANLTLAAYTAGVYEEPRYC